MINLPELNLGIVAVSRDCFPLSLSEQRRKAVVAACGEQKVNVSEQFTIVSAKKCINLSIYFTQATQL